MCLLTILTYCVENYFSDLHLTIQSVPKARLNGDLIALQNFPEMTKELMQEFLFTVMTQTQYERLMQKEELDISFSIKDLANFRINIFHQYHGISMVFRIIPIVIPSIDQIGLPSSISELLSLQNGLILVTGPTGSGKSTTLAAMVDALNEQYPFHIVTLEDPIEFIHTNKKAVITQREIKKDTVNFNNALRAVLRQDPDVILIGEMRDLETIRLALTAAETGHLVLASLHTSSAARTLHRLIDVFPAEEKATIRSLLAESLQAVICQSLVKANNGGRVAAFEILRTTPAIRHLIREDKIAQIQNAIQTGAGTGMCTLEQSLQTLVQKQIIDHKIFEIAQAN